MSELNLENIINENLKLMNSYEKGGMGLQICKSQISGEVPINFYYDKETGRIKYFTNYKKEYEEEKYGYASYIIKLSYEKSKKDYKEYGLFSPVIRLFSKILKIEDFDIKVTNKIERLYFKDSPDNISKNVKDVLNKCMEIYNKKYNKKE